MKYVALLRGINVGGNAKVKMSRLKETFEKLGFRDVKTYINSGNVIFQTKDDESLLAQNIEKAIAKDFGLNVPVLIRSEQRICKLCDKIPSNWTNDQTMKCDVLFLWHEIDDSSILKQIAHNPEVEDVVYLPGALVWRIDRSNATKGKMVKIVGTPLHKQITVRNINTVRTLQKLMAAT